MRLSAPKKTTWWIAVVFGVIGSIGLLGVKLPVVEGYSKIFTIFGFVLLAVATAVKDL